MRFGNRDKHLIAFLINFSTTFPTYKMECIVSTCISTKFSQHFGFWSVDYSVLFAQNCSEKVEKMKSNLFVVIAIVAFVSITSAQIPNPALVNRFVPSAANARTLTGQASAKISIDLVVADALSNFNVSSLPLQLQVRFNRH